MGQTPTNKLYNRKRFHPGPYFEGRYVPKDAIRAINLPPPPIRQTLGGYKPA